MKKELRFIVPILVLILLCSLLPFIRAQDAATAGSTPAPADTAEASGTSPTLEQTAQMTPGEQIQEQIGFNPEKAPKTPQETRDYLQQEWTKIVASKPVIGSIHKFFLEHPLIFKIVFNTPYVFSLTFFMVVLMWIFIMLTLTTLLARSDLLKGPPATAIGIGAAIILAQVGVYNHLSVWLSNLALSPQNGWVRFVIWTIIVLGFVIFFYIDQQVAETLKKRKEKRKKLETEEKAELAKKEVEALAEGLEEGLKLKKELPKAPPQDYSI
jgi:hypothetical protein